MTSESTGSIQCKKCQSVFSPDLKSKGVWKCPDCGTKNPNLKRHYKSLADLCILGFLLTCLIMVAGYGAGGMNLVFILFGAHATFLLITIIVVYKSKEVWTDTIAKSLLWTVFSLALLLNVIAPYLLSGAINGPHIVIYSVVFSYLFWLKSQTKKCSLPE